MPLTRRHVLTFTMPSLVLASTTARAQTAKEVIALADAKRNPDQSFRLRSTLSDYASGKLRDQDILVIYSSPDKATGQFRNLVRYIAPPRDAGKVAMLDGASLWFYDPDTKASVRISRQQRLLGQAAIGDVLTVNLAVDYTGQMVGTEQIDDADRHARGCVHLNMTATNNLATYARVEYWVEERSFMPIKAKFYSDSGRMLKILYYRGFQMMLDAERPTGAIIIDAVDNSQITVVAFSDWRYQAVPDAWFQRDFLPNLPAE